MQKKKTKYPGVYRNERGKYLIVYSYTVTDPVTGQKEHKQRYKYGFDRIEDARDALAEMRAGKEQKTKKEQAVTMAGAFALWKDHAEGVRSFSPVTVKNTECYMRMIEPFLPSDTLVRDITPERYAKFCRDIKAHGYAGETLYNLNATVRKLVNLCYRRKIISENPLDYVDNMKAEYKDPDSYRLVTKAEFDTLDKWMQGQTFTRLGVNPYPMHRVCLYLLYYTGARIGEVLALTPEDITDGAVRVVKSYVSDFRIVKSPKNLKHRNIPVPGFVSDIAREYIREAGIKDGERVIGVSHGAVDGVLKKACQEEGMKPVSCHCFRHTYISNLLRAGVPLAAVEKVTGDTQETILKRYSNYFDTDDALIVGALESL